MQQNVVTLTLASLIGLFLSGYWMLTEIRFVSTMSEFDQDITWLVQAPLMLFILFLILLSLMLFIGTVGDFSFSDFKAEVPWKKLFGLIVIFNSIIVVFIAIFEYFDIKENFIGQLVVAVLLVATYIYGAIKCKINPIFFLVSLCAFTSAILYIVFEMVL